MRVSEINMYKRRDDRPFALFLVRNRRYVTNLIPNHVRARTSHLLFLLLSSSYTLQPFRAIPAVFNEFHAIGRARRGAADLNLDDRKGDRAMQPSTIRPFTLASAMLNNIEDKSNQ